MGVLLIAGPEAESRPERAVRGVLRADGRGAHAGRDDFPARMSAHEHSITIAFYFMLTSAA
jgi:hypothetical protein